MPWQSSPYVFVLLAAAAIAATCALYGLASIRREGARGHVVAFVALCLPIVYWCALYAVQIATPTLAGKMLVRKFIMFGMLGLGPTWLAFALTYTGRERYLRAAVAVNAVFVGGFVIIWVVTLMTAIPAPVLRGAHLVTRGSVTLLATELGPVAFVFLAYLWGSFLVGAWWLVEHALRSPAATSRQSVLIILALAVPESVSVLRVLGVVPANGVNLAPVSMVVSVVLLWIAVFRYRLFGVLPLAWDTVLAQIQDGVVVLNEREGVVEANAAAKSLAPGPDALVGAPASERIPDYDQLQVDSTFVSEHDERAVEYERSPLRVNGETRGWVIISRDVTDRERRRTTLEDENDRLDAFASVVAHDLRNPLAVISGYAEVAEETGDQAAFDTIHDTVERMDDLLEELLVLSREGETVDDIEPVSLAAVARDAHDAIGDDAVALCIETDAVVLADEARLRQVFDNLLRNARDHNDGPITVTLDGLPDGFVVADDGVGLDADARESAFESGFTTRADGTGFGLAIVADVVDAHGWTIKVGGGAGGGARFEVHGVKFADRARTDEYGPGDLNE